MQVRFAEARDRGPVLRMAREFLAESGLDVPWDAAWASIELDSLMADPEAAVFVLDDGGVCGVLAARAGARAFTPERIAQELMWWVRPEARGAGAAKLLLDAFEGWARARGCDVLALGAHHRADERLGLLYRRRGYAVAETIWMRRV